MRRPLPLALVSAFLVSLLSAQLCAAPGDPQPGSGASIAAALSPRLLQLKTMTNPLTGLLAVRDDESLSLPEKEWVLWRYAQALARYSRTPEREEALRFLKEYQPLVLVPHPESATYMVPRFPIRSSAFGTENVWISNAAYIQAARLIASNDPGLYDFFSNAQRAEKLGIKRALGDASFLTLTSLESAFIPAQYTPIASELVVSLAINLNSVYLYTALVDFADATSTASLAPRLSQLVGPKRAHQLLMRAAHREAVRPLVLSSLVALPVKGEETANFVAGLLGEARAGASAALALSTLPGDELVSLLGPMVKTSPSALVVRRMALSLRLNGSQVSEDFLRLKAFRNLSQGAGQ